MNSRDDKKRNRMKTDKTLRSAKIDDMSVGCGES